MFSAGWNEEYVHLRANTQRCQKISSQDFLYKHHLSFLKCTVWEVKKLLTSKSPFLPKHNKQKPYMSIRCILGPGTLTEGLCAPGWKRLPRPPPSILAPDSPHPELTPHQQRPPLIPAHAESGVFTDCVFRYQPNNDLVHSLTHLPPHPV